MKKLLFLLLGIVIFSSFDNDKTLKGTWEFRGDTYNGKYDGPPKNYKLQRKYSSSEYDAYLLEKGEKTVKFESGKYQLKGDTCLETQTFSAQPSKLKGITIHYFYSVRNDTLILRAKLPSGTIEEDYWKKVK